MASKSGAIEVLARMLFVALVGFLRAMRKLPPLRHLYVSRNSNERIQIISFLSQVRQNPRKPNILYWYTAYSDARHNCTGIKSAQLAMWHHREALRRAKAALSRLP